MDVNEINEEAMIRVRKGWSELNNNDKIKERFKMQMSGEGEVIPRIGLCHEQTFLMPKIAHEEPKVETINHPDHYLGKRKYEPIDVINDWELNFQTGNAVKYISRVGRKDESKIIEDLRKAVWYLEWEIKRIEGEKS
jgi:hypothetical protein